MPPLPGALVIPGENKAASPSAMHQDERASLLHSCRCSFLEDVHIVRPVSALSATPAAQQEDARDIIAMIIIWVEAPAVQHIRSLYSESPLGRSVAEAEEMARRHARSTR
jgi:hypothetical protein